MRAQIYSEAAPASEAQRRKADAVAEMYKARNKNFFALPSARTVAQAISTQPNGSALEPTSKSHTQTAQPTMPPAGWYEDSEASDRLRWEDGIRWTEHRKAR